MTAATKTKAEQLTCGKLRIRDFKRIELFDVDLAGNHLTLSGPNGSGKTTVIDSILSLLNLSKSREIPEPVRTGQSKADISCELIDEHGEIRYKLRKSWEAGKTTYTIHGADGKPVPPTQFKKLIDPYLCNPIELLTMRPQDQLDEVLRVFGVEPPIEQVKEITGERHNAKEGESAAQYLERLSADQTGLYYDRRRDAHRTATQKKAALEEQREHTAPNGEEYDGPSMGELLDRRKKVEERGGFYTGLKHSADTLRREAEQKEKRLTERKSQREKAAAELEELKRKVAYYETQIEDLDTRIQTGERVVTEAKNDAEAAAEKLASLDDPSIELERIDGKIETAQQHAKAAQNRELHREHLKRLEADAEAATVAYDRLDFVLTQLRELRASLLKGTDFGIDGLEIGDAELRLGGVPFRQASTAQQIDAACGIGFHKRPGARIAVIDNAEHLDSKYRQRVIDRASEYGCQLFLAVVRDGDELEWQVVEATS